jgi:Zn-dependent M32 family carboxypeptidase
MIRKYIIEEDGDIVVNKKECLLLPEFKALFDRDKGSKNDLKGKHQLVACGELKYIYYNYDPRSEFYNTPASVSHEIVRDLSGLPDNWKTDKVFEKAIEMYKKLQRLSSAGSAYFSADSALYDLGTDTKEVSDMIRELKEELKTALKTHKKVNKEYTLEDLEFVTKIMNKLDSVNSLQSNIINLINKMPGLSKTIKTLKEVYSEEDNENNIVVGNRTLGNRED